MLALMYASSGVGLAANQVGRKERLCVVNECGSPDSGIEYVLLNPVLTGATEATEEAEEGCLSVPHCRAKVARHREISVAYMTLGGEVNVLTTSGQLARIIQHEVDHLDGLTILDRATKVEWS